MLFVALGEDRLGCNAVGPDAIRPNLGSGILGEELYAGLGSGLRDRRSWMRSATSIEPAKSTYAWIHSKDRKKIYPGQVCDRGYYTSKNRLYGL